MSYSPAKSVEAHDADAGGHLAMWFFGVVGALTIAAGFWFAFAPTSGELQLPFATIEVESIPELLGPSLLIAGGVVMAGSMFAGAWRDYHFDRNWLLAIVQGVLGLLGAAVAVLGVFGILDRLDLYSLPALPF